MNEKFLLMSSLLLIPFCCNLYAKRDASFLTNSSFKNIILIWYIIPQIIHIVLHQRHLVNQGWQATYFINSKEHYMNLKLQKILKPIIPFIILGILLALAITFFLVFSYLLLWGILIGAIVGLVSYVFRLFSSRDHNEKKEKQKKGRVIEHDDRNH